MRMEKCGDMTIRIKFNLLNHYDKRTLKIQIQMFLVECIPCFKQQASFSLDAVS